MKRQKDTIFNLQMEVRSQPKVLFFGIKSGTLNPLVFRMPKVYCLDPVLCQNLYGLYLFSFMLVGWALFYIDLLKSKIRDFANRYHHLTTNELQK